MTSTVNYAWKLICDRGRQVRTREKDFRVDLERFCQIWQYDSSVKNPTPLPEYDPNKNNMVPASELGNIFIFPGFSSMCRTAQTWFTALQRSRRTTRRVAVLRHARLVAQRAQR